MQNQPFNQAEFVANRFGGRAKLAEAIEEKRSTVDYWCRETGVIPEDRRLRVLKAAEELGADLTPFDFIRHLVMTPPRVAAAA